jgi:ABC-type lipoprotein release transport system permease subunit
VNAERLLARTLRRNHRWSIVVVVLLVGVAGGLATGLIAGSTRTRTALDRFMTQARMMDIMISTPPGAVGPTELERIRALPGVRAVSWLLVPSLFLRGHDVPPMNVNAAGGFGVDTDVPRLLRGRPAHADSATEVVLGEAIARHVGVDVGDLLQFDSFSPGESDDEPLPGPSPAVKVVGISRHPADLLSDNSSTMLSYLPPGFWRRYEGEIGEEARLVAVDTGGAPTPAEEARITSRALAILGRDARPEEVGESSGSHLSTTLDFVAAAMVTLAGAVALAGAVVGVIVVARVVRRATVETVQLASLGMTPGERALGVVLAFLPVAFAAAILAFIVAASMSPVLPFGLARQAEPDPGFALDAIVLVAGLVVTFAFVSLTAVVLAVSGRRSPRRSRTPRPARLSSAAGRVGFPLPAVYGLDLALGGRTRGERSGGRTAVVGFALASFAVSAALVIADSVNHLFASPAAYGQSWDLSVPERAIDSLSRQPEVTSAGRLLASVMHVDGRSMYVRGINSTKGVAPITVTRGTAPGPGEIVLGRRTMANLRVDIGDTVSVAGSESQREFRVVGETVMAGVIDVPQAGWGAVVPMDELKPLGLGDSVGPVGVISLAKGVDAEAFAERFGTGRNDVEHFVTQPVELARLRQIQGLPWALTIFLAIVGFAALQHALLLTTSQRRRDLAVLRALGMRPREVSVALLVSTSILAGLGVLVGCPLGVLAGRFLWQGLARSLGVVVTVQIPWLLSLGVTAAGSLGVAMLASLPVRATSRARPRSCAPSDRHPPACRRPIGPRISRSVSQQSMADSAGQGPVHRSSTSYPSTTTPRTTRVNALRGFVLATGFRSSSKSVSGWLSRQASTGPSVQK